jgi:hypothetical protein
LVGGVVFWKFGGLRSQKWRRREIESEQETKWRKEGGRRLEAIRIQDLHHSLRETVKGLFLCRREDWGHQIIVQPRRLKIVEAMSFEYICEDPSKVDCAEECVGLDACEDCKCAVLEENGSGPWGNFMDLFFCLLPILFLVVVTIKPNPIPTTKSLPTAAFMMYLVRLMYLGSDPLLTSASVILGFHEAITPLSIMAGAIALFESMEATYCLPYMMREMKALTEGHPIADSML